MIHFSKPRRRKHRTLFRNRIKFNNFIGGKGEVASGSGEANVACYIFDE